MFALLQFVQCGGERDDDEWTVSHAEYVQVVKINSSKEKLQEYAAAYSYRFYAAANDLDDALDALEADGRAASDEEHQRLHDTFSDQYRVSGALISDMTFHIVEVQDGGENDDEADDAPAPLVGGAVR
ncbi:hypothetical protein ABID65_000362 [Bradyrhizobium sp. S3.9.2]|uniref:hypothetical protein n=1 Tax=Bradyrhizobium sp. S3.9.2 TaxID=3156432 RepID=UPI003399CC8B